MQDNIESDRKLPKIDAVVKINISSNGLEAILYIEPPQNGGARVSSYMIDMAIQKAKIHYGLITGAIENIKAHPQYQTEILIAKGLAPVHGEDGDIQYLFEIALEAHPKERDDGTVDYRDLGLIENAKKGQLLCKIKLATKGTDGMTVMGRKMMAIAGRPVDSPMGSNTGFNQEQTELQATADGYISVNGKKVNVISTFVVGNDVDNSIGNIKFVGSVQINGNVLEGFSVEADGDISIGGVVEGANIKSGGNIVIRGGAIGRGRSIIECKGNLNSTFLENCKVFIGGNLKAENIMNCYIKCGLNIELSGLRSKIIGGQCIAGQNITASIIGSPANLPTELILGTIPELISKHSALKKEIENLEMQIDQLNKIVMLLRQYKEANRLSSDKTVMLDNSAFSLEEAKSRYEIVKEELAQLNPQIENTVIGKVVCRDIMYRGVKVTIGGVHMEIDRTVACSSFVNIKGEIKVESAV
jgi:uncharacterized protein (DUF342 family)